MMDSERKRERYGRLYRQLKELLPGSDDLTARMATMAAVLHHKAGYFFWTGFYLV